jgi:ketosteroid isomerase-like protein
MIQKINILAMMKKSWLFLVLVLLATFTFAQTKDEQDVARAIEKLRKAMVDADKTALQSLVSDKLSYGHSPGYVEDKKVFVENILNGKSDFVSIDLSNQTITISDNVAIVRHKLDAVTNNEGKPGEAHLLVLLVWQKKSNQWKLLARQAVKAPVAQ